MTSAKSAPAAEVIAALLKPHVDLRLRAWDGSEAGPEDAPVLVVRSPRALQRIGWRPGELGLARAYISGDLDIEGDLTDGLRQVLGAFRDKGARSAPSVSLPTVRGIPPLAAKGIALAPAAWAAARAVAQLKLLGPPPEPPGCELRVRGRLHSRARDQAVIAGHLVGDTVRLIENAGFEVIGVEAMREHYVRTIRAWLDNFEQNLPAVEAVLTAEQVRVWRLYLAGGALAFEEGRMGVDQILAVRRDSPRRAWRAR